MLYETNIASVFCLDLLKSSLTSPPVELFDVPDSVNVTDS